MSNLYFTVAVIVIFVVLSVLVFRHARRVGRAASEDWDELLGRLEIVDRDRIAAIAHDALADELTSSGEPAFALDSEAISAMLGGLNGLEVLERNCRVLVDLATYLQRWYPEALVVAEQLRLNARELEWHVNRLRGAAQTGNLQTAFGDYAQRAVVIYYQMSRNVLELYTRATVPGTGALQSAL